MRRLPLLLAFGLLAAGCSEQQAPPAPTTTEAPTTTTSIATAAGDPPALKVTPVFKVDRPTALTTRPGDPSLYVTEKAGRVRAVRDGQVVAEPMLDLSAEISDDGERGLLGLAYAPEGNKAYVNFTDKAGDTHIVEFATTPEGRFDLGSRRELLYVDQPFANHNGGQLAFGPDKHLYIGLGDGGGSGDPQKNAQNLTVLLGKILRISPTPSTTKPYTIPFDNPFAKRESARGEIWAYGLRNPWTFSFDSADRSLWIADVGQNQWEEINRVAYDPAGGQNYGWPLREGTHRFTGEKPTAAIDPVYEYDHSSGACSVTGGRVYRGEVIPGMAGRYVFGDFCNGRMTALTAEGTEWNADQLNITVPQVAHIAEDQRGELYTLSLDGQVGRIDAA